MFITCLPFVPLQTVIVIVNNILHTPYTLIDCNLISSLEQLYQLFTTTLLTTLCLQFYYCLCFVWTSISVAKPRFIPRLTTNNWNFPYSYNFTKQFLDFHTLVNTEYAWKSLHFKILFYSPFLNFFPSVFIYILIKFWIRLVCFLDWTRSVWWTN